MCSHCRRLLPAVPTWPTQLDCSSKRRQAYPDTKAPCQKDHSWVWTLLTQSPAAKSGQLCLTKAVPILQANGQLCLLLGSVLNCMDPGGSVGPTDDAHHLSTYLLLPEFHLHIPNGLCGAFSASLTSSVCEPGRLSRFVLNLRAFQMHLRGTFFSC